MTMSKQDTKKDDQVLDSLLPDIENMSREEADALFIETGADLRNLRARLQEAAKGMAGALRKNNTPAPRSLARAIEALDDAQRLPQTSDEDAAAKATDIVRRFRKPQPVPEGAKILKAARRSPNVPATDDDEAVEKLAADLRKELIGDDAPEK
jgi:hypothetical protein